MNTKTTDWTHRPPAQGHRGAVGRRRRILRTAAVLASFFSITGFATAPGTGHPAKRVSSQAPFPVALKDQTGHWVRVSSRPTRIVSLTLGSDEVLSALVPPRDIVGIDPYSTNPVYSHIAGYVKSHRLPLMNGSSAESIVAARPDLVLTADYNSPTVVQQLRRTGIPVYEFNNFNSISNIEQNILIIGRLTGTEKSAGALVASMKAQIAQIRRNAPAKRLRVLYFSYNDVAGRNTTLNSVIRDAGGINAAGKINGWQQVSVEQMIAMNPDVIIVPNDSGSSDQQLKAFLAMPGVKALRAVREHHVYTAPDGDLSDVAQFVVQGVRDVQQMLKKAAGTP